MRISRCRKCKTRFLVGRFFCPSCKSDDLEMLRVDEARVIETVRLMAIPEPFPEDYSIAMVDADGILFFTRTYEYLQKGDAVKITEDELGPICHKI